MLSLKIPGGAAVKSTVKASLADKYISAVIAAMSVVFAALFLYVMTSATALMFGEVIILPIAFALLFAVFILHPVFLGAVRWFWRVTDGSDDGPETVFYYFGSFFRYSRAVKCILYVGFKVCGIFFVCLLPYLIVTLLSNSWIYQFLGTDIPLWAAGLVMVQSFLRIAGIFIALVLVSKYYLVYSVVVMDDNILILEAAHISEMVSRHSASAFLGLIVSLFFWILISFTLLPIIYTAPLILGCYAVHCRYALVNYNMNLDYYNGEEYNTLL